MVSAGFEADSTVAGFTIRSNIVVLSNQDIDIKDLYQVNRDAYFLGCPGNMLQ